MFWNRKCRTVARLLWDYMAQSLSDADRARVEAHLERCRACRRDADGYRRTVRLVATDRERTAPELPAAWLALRAGLEAVPPVPVDRRSSRIRPTVVWAGAAAALLLVAAFAVRFMLSMPSGSAAHPSPDHVVKHLEPGRLNGAAIAGAHDRGRRATGVRSAGNGPLQPVFRGPTIVRSNVLGQPILHRTPQDRTPIRMPVPDAAYLDGRDAVWLPKSLPDWLRGPVLPKFKDDFVRVAPPQLAGHGGAALEAAKHYLQQQAEVVDPRLFRKVTLQEKAVSLEDFCADLEAQVNVSLHANRGVRDEKVTLFVKETPARDVLRAVARLFGFFWARSGDQGAYKYEITQDLRSQLAEEELRNQDFHAALVALDDGMSAYKPYLDRSFDDLAADLDKTSGDAYSLVGKMVRGGWGGARLYQQLSPSELAALRTGEKLEFSTSSGQPDRRLPGDWKKPLIRSFGGGGSLGEFLQDPSTNAAVDLQINRSELGQLSFTNGLRVYHLNPNGEEGAGYGFERELAVGRSPSVAKPENAKSNEGLRADPSMTKEVSLHPKPSCPWFAANSAKKGREWWDQFSAHLMPFMYQQDPSRQDLMQGPHVTSADVWAEVHRRTGLPIVADSYTRLYPLDRTAVEHVSLFDALCKLGDTMGVRWMKDGEFLRCRSTSFFWDKLKEVPNRLLARWQKDSELNGGLPLDDFLEMATLSDSQLDSTQVGDAIWHCWGLEEWDVLKRPIGYYSPRPFARLMAGMPAADRDRFLQPDGTAVDSLPAGTQQEIMNILSKQYGKYAPSPQHLLELRFRVDYVPAGRYVWRQEMDPDKQLEGFRLPVVSHRTAEAALAVARKLDPDAGPDHIVRSAGVFCVTQFDAKGNAFVFQGLRPYIFTRKASP